MIVVRDIFQLKFGKAKDAKALWKKGSAINKKLGYGPGRATVDLVGSYYTFVLETTYKDLSDYEKALKKTLAAKEWSDWYQKFMPLVESGHREIFTILE
ncbi:MAG TPA: NIPSNAP family protein [Candidatus Hodarchaeales archaeon]|nr:NIPSNAP family protein [Candidatus Hodarchaeales archaeon]